MTNTILDNKSKHYEIVYCLQLFNTVLNLIKLCLAWFLLKFVYNKIKKTTTIYLYTHFN